MNNNLENVTTGLTVMLSSVLLIGGTTGWVRNIIAVTQSDFSNINGELVVRVVGIPMAPVGAVMGWVP